MTTETPTDLWLARLRVLTVTERAALLTEMMREMAPGEIEMMILRLFNDCESAREDRDRLRKWLLEHAPRVRNLRAEIRKLQRALMVARGVHHTERLDGIYKRLDALEKAK